MPALAAAAGLAACAKEAPVSIGPPPATVYSVDLQGAARECEAPKNLALADGRTAEAQMVVANDGGWCAISVALPGTDHPTPFGAGLLIARPGHGKVYIHDVGYSTRIDYTPQPGYAGADTFTVELLPGAPRLHVSVSVQAGSGRTASPGKG